MPRHPVRNIVLLLVGFLVVTLVLAQDSASTGDSGSSDEVVAELRAIHQRLGELISQLEGDGGGSADIGRLERRVALLEQQVRQSAAREAQRRLQSLRSQFEADGDPQAAADRVRDIRTGLESTYATPNDMDLDQQVFGRELRTHFDALVEMLEGGGNTDEAFSAVETELQRLAQGDASQATGTRDSQQAAAPDEAEEEYNPQVLGPQVYATNCAACHQANGQGVEGAFPPLAGNEFVTGEPGPVIETVLHGRGGMPAFSSLSNQEIAAVITHERTSWENDAGPITPDMVETVRGGGTLEDGGADPNTRPGAAN